ncbi:MAG: hypothetical protein JNM07_02625 [Phycisphaerae bacterium]|nr:hypothetical protein [Phycisphaerae bacterium]
MSNSSSTGENAIAGAAKPTSEAMTVEIRLEMNNMIDLSLFAVAEWSP